MSIHWGCNLTIKCNNEEDAEKLYSYLLENNVKEDVCQFNTNDFLISADGNNPISYDQKEVVIFMETSEKSIDEYNANEFFNELDEVAKNAQSSIENAILFFMPEESKCSYTYVKKLSNKAFEMFVEDYVDTNICDEDRDEFIKDTKAEFADKNWMIVCGEYEMITYMNNDKSGRTCLWEYEEIIKEWASDIIENWKFPWKEKVGMWAACFDEDGELFWDNE